MIRLSLALAVLFLAICNIGIAQDATENTSLSALLSSYYGIKDALVAGDGATASANAKAFVTLANKTVQKDIPKATVKSLVSDAHAIAGTKDIKKQRDLFSTFSDDMIAVAKAVKISEEPVYQQYCPMKKASWLSSEKAIRNPYYGSAMLTCGKVTTTY
jgi:hypothetical protein